MRRAIALVALLTATPAAGQVAYPPIAGTVDLTGYATKAELGTVKTTADGAMTKADAALADGLTSADRQQAVRVQLTPDANGRALFVFPKAYATGVKPAVTTTAETPNGAAYRNDASIEEGSTTNTQAVVLVQRIPRTLVVNLLGSVLNIISPVTTPVWVNILVRAP